MIEEFERHLRGTNLSENTISSYLFAIRQYSSQYDGITKKNLRAYKVWLIENYKPKTVNLRLRAINCYLESIGKESWKMPFVRVQQKAFLENVISEADYEYFKTCLKRDDELFWYFVIRFLAATGARVSELIQIKVEHIKLGHLDLYSKGGKLRRIYIPKALQNEALSWLNDKHQESRADSVSIFRAGAFRERGHCCKGLGKVLRKSAVVSERIVSDQKRGACVLARSKRLRKNNASQNAARQRTGGRGRLQDRGKCADRIL